MSKSSRSPQRNDSTVSTSLENNIHSKCACHSSRRECQIINLKIDLKKARGHLSKTLVPTQEPAHYRTQVILPDLFLVFLFSHAPPADIALFFI